MFVFSLCFFVFLFFCFFCAGFLPSKVEHLCRLSGMRAMSVGVPKSPLYWFDGSGCDTIDAGGGEWSDSGLQSALGKLRGICGITNFPFLVYGGMKLGFWAEVSKFGGVAMIS